MTLETLLAYLAATVAFGLAVFVLVREPRRLAYLAFALGMAALGVRELLGVVAMEALYEADIARWHRYRLLAQSLAPGFWLLFSLTFARAYHERFLSRWRVPLAVTFAAPLLVCVVGWKSLVVRGATATYPLPSWLVPVGPAGFALHVLLLLSAVLVLMNLESTLRASSGAVRWQIKFMVVGLGALFGMELFLHSQVLLYSSIQTTLFPIGSVALLLASAMVAFSLLRSRLESFDVYPSEAFLYNSLTLLVVGVYLLVVAGLVQAIEAVAGARRAPLVALVIFVAIVGLAVFLLSNEMQQRVKRFVNFHLKRPSYDYRKIWDTFTRRTSSALESGPLCAAVTRTVAETFGCASATIWLAWGRERQLYFGGSTALSADEARQILKRHHDGRPLFGLIEAVGNANASSQSHPLPIDLERLKPSLEPDAASFVGATEARYCVPLVGSDEGAGSVVGFLTVSERVAGQRFDAEDIALLATFGEQASAALESRRLLREVEQAREKETFQTLSAFFIHDLKNLASRLSLSMQNLPAHYDKPEFRKDLLETISKSVAKIDTMTGRLSSLTRGLELEQVDCDLNGLVEETLAGMNGAMRASLEQDFHELPPIPLDREQIQKVLVNLLLNAQEATGDEGRIRLSTGRDNGFVSLTVADDGCGMSADFIQSSLFKPFQTTKKQGLGIGLYHSKTIVEAHGGRIEVESEGGLGTTFRVLLPASARSKEKRSN